MNSPGSYRLGRLLRAHGLKGDLVLQLYRPRRVPPGGPHRHPGQPVWLHLDDRDPVEASLTVVRPVDAIRRVIHLKGVDGREPAEALYGAELMADPTSLPKLLVDEADHLVGALAYLGEGGAELGPVLEIRDNGAQALLVIGDGEILIPLVPAFVGPLEDGPNGRRVKLTPIPGLLEAKQA